MIGGVGVGGDDVLNAEAADDVAVAVELGVGRKAGSRAGIGIGEAIARKLLRGCADIARVRGEIAELALQAGGPGVEGGVAEVAVDAAEIEAR